MAGEPWQIMYANAVKLLERTIYLHPFPCTRGEAVGPALPEIKGPGLKWGNARMAMRWEIYSQCRVELRSTGQEVLFWVGANDDTKYQHWPTHQHWPTPSDPDDGFAINGDHPHYEKIEQWACGAVELDDFISGSKVYLTRVLKIMKHPMWVEKFWPQIVPFVGAVPEILVKGMREPRPTSLQLDKVFQEEIQDKFTLASLLPKDQELTAWVGRYHP